MDWILFNEKNKPKDLGDYMCFVPDSKHYNEHHAEYYWDGKYFRDLQALLGNNRIVPVTHYFKITNP